MPTATPTSTTGAAYESAPPGFEHVVLKLKDKYGEDSPRPFQIAWSMANKGIEPVSETGCPRCPNALEQRLKFMDSREQSAQEGMSPTTMGPLMRKGVGGIDQELLKKKLARESGGDFDPQKHPRNQEGRFSVVDEYAGDTIHSGNDEKAARKAYDDYKKSNRKAGFSDEDNKKWVSFWKDGKRVQESARYLRERDPGRQQPRAISWIATVREASAHGDGPGTAKVVLITEGPGNRVDRNYYPGEMLRKSARTFEGAKCFLNHPTMSEEEERPERDVRESCGWFSDVAVESDAGRAALVATLHFASNDAGKEARQLAESALRYQEQFPGSEKVFCGFSVNAEGPVHQEQMGQEWWNVIDAIQNVISVDLVTFPARGGRVIALRESEAVPMISARFRQRLDGLLASRLEVARGS